MPSEIIQLIIVGIIVFGFDCFLDTNDSIRYAWYIPIQQKWIRIKKHVTASDFLRILSFSLRYFDQLNVSIANVDAKAKVYFTVMTRNDESIHIVQCWNCSSLSRSIIKYHAVRQRNHCSFYFIWNGWKSREQQFLFVPLHRSAHNSIKFENSMKIDKPNLT